MNKFLSLIAALALATSSLGLNAQNVGTDQLSTVSPQPGVIDLEVNESGFGSMLLQFNGGAEVDRNANLCITVKRNGRVISNVPASNTEMVKFDGVMSYVWQVAFFRVMNSEAKAGGDYQVIIPAGYFLVGENKTPNKEIILNYTMPVSTISVYPPETNRAEIIQDVVVTFGSAQRVELVEDPAHPVIIFDLYAVVTDPNDTTGDDDDEIPDVEIGVKPTLSVSGNQLFIHLDKPITSPGTWKVDIPEGIVNLYDANDNATPNTALIYQYKIPNYALGKPTIFPEEGKTLGFPGIITLTLEKGTTVGAINNMGASKIYPIDENGNLGKAIATYRCAPNNSKFYKDPKTGATITSNLNKVFLINDKGEDAEIFPAPGNYQLITSDMLYQIVKGAEKSYISTLYFNYEVVDGGYYDMEFTPSQDETLESLQEVKVRFLGADEVKINYAPAWFSSDVTNYLFYPSKDPENPEGIILKCQVPVTVPGTYTLSTSADCISVDDDCVTVYAEYTISNTSGVECIGNVTVFPSVFDIVNAQGIILKRNATVEDLKTLPAGIYIAGGKKFVKH